MTTTAWIGHEAIAEAPQAGEVYGPEIDGRLAALAPALRRTDARRPPAVLPADPALQRIRQQAAAILRSLAGQELRTWIARSEDGTDQLLVAVQAIEALVLQHFSDAPWFDDVSLALARCSCGGDHYLDENALAEVLSSADLQQGPA